MKTLRIAAFALLGAALLAHPVSAAIIEDFQFGDTNGTVITGTANSANAGNMWLTQEGAGTPPAAIESSVQNGSYRINKNLITGQISNTLDIATISSGKVWLVAEIAGWSYTSTASAPSERVRFAFLDNDTPANNSSTITAQMQIDRLPSGNLTITGDAGGSGSTATVASSADFGLVRSTPLQLILEVDADADTYTISYIDGANPVVSLPVGNLGERSAGVEREPRSVRFAYTGTYDAANGEFVDVDRIYVTDVNPIPEPATLAMLGIACAAMIGWRRRGA